MIKPEVLANALNDKDKPNDPLILNIGPSGAIKGSVEIGPVDNEKGMRKLEEKIKGLSKNQAIVLYCGC